MAAWHHIPGDRMHDPPPLMIVCWQRGIIFLEIGMFGLLAAPAASLLGPSPSPPIPRTTMLVMNPNPRRDSRGMCEP